MPNDALNRHSIAIYNTTMQSGQKFLLPRVRFQQKLFYLAFVFFLRIKKTNLAGRKSSPCLMKRGLKKGLAGCSFQ